MEEQKSEVARLMQQIKQEYEAGQRGLYGLAQGTANHRFITRRMEAMGACHQELTKLVGPHEATLLLEKACSEEGTNA